MADNARTLRGIAIAVVVCLAVLAVPLTVAAVGRANRQTRTVKTITPEQARANVENAVDASIATDTFNFTSTMSEAGGTGMSLASHGTINLTPLAMRATSNIPPYGEITSWVNTTTIWEQGGGQYGMTGEGRGSGAPLSGFAELVESTLGPREGPVAMMSLASPTGYLNLARAAITSASNIGPGEYEVTLDAGELVHRAGMTDEETKASTAAYMLLRAQGYTDTTVHISIDAADHIRSSASAVHFADGGSVNASVTFSDFGTAGTIHFPT